MGPGGPGAGPFTHLVLPRDTEGIQPDGTLAMWWPATPDGEGRESKRREDNWQRSSTWHSDAEKMMKQGMQG